MAADSDPPIIPGDPGIAYIARTLDQHVRAFSQFQVTMEGRMTTMEATLAAAKQLGEAKAQREEKLDERLREAEGAIILLNAEKAKVATLTETVSSLGEKVTTLRLGWAKLVGIGLASGAVASVVVSMAAAFLRGH